MEVKLDAYIPSKGECEKYWKRFRTVMAGEMESGQNPRGYQGWNYLLRTTRKGIGHNVLTVDVFGGKGLADPTFKHWENGAHWPVGVRVGFNLVYDPNSELVRAHKTSYFAKRVPNAGSFEEEHALRYPKLMISRVPTIMFGGKECIWLNKRECEEGKAQTMECVSLHLLSVSESFFRKDEEAHNDFGMAFGLQAQCAKLLKEGCSKQELRMIVSMQMSDEDGYEKLTPVFTKEQQDVVDRVQKEFKDKKQGKALSGNLEELDKLLRIDSYDEGDCENLSDVKRRIRNDIYGLVKEPQTKKALYEVFMPLLSPEDVKWKAPEERLKLESYYAFTFGKLYIALEAALSSKTEEEMFEKASESYRTLSGKDLEKGLISNLALDIAAKEGVQIERTSNQNNGEAE